MGRTDKDHHLPETIWRKVPVVLSHDWVALFFDLYRALRFWINHHRREGIYEILDYDSTLELVDPKGETAVLKKRQRVKFLQNYIMAFQDYAWGDGKILADYQCSPGVVVDRYQEGDRWNILISLRETKNSGEIEDFYIERTTKHSFKKEDEWWQVELRHHTQRLKLAVIFPKKRRCRRAILLQRGRHRTNVLGPEHFTELPDGRQILTWETRKIPRFEIFTLRWKW